MKKDAGEIALMRRAVEVTEAVLEDVVAAATPGLTERAICTRLMASLLSGGGESIPFEPLVQSGPNAAFPHGQTSDRRLERGDVLLIDLSTTVDGYHSDITRTFVVGDQPTNRLREIYAVVEAANEAGRAAVRPGATCEDVDRATRQVIVEAGYGKQFSHRTGHGLGLDVHEDPSVVEGNTLQLEPGMTLTIEPGIYVEGWGGVRIEDDVVVTDQGCESLSTFNRALRLVGV
jgi:Xaa-Pro dipeptidase